MAAVVSNHAARVQDRQREDSVGGHEAHEPNVSTIIHGRNLAPVVVQNEGDEPTEGSSFSRYSYVTYLKSPL